MAVVERIGRRGLSVPQTKAAGRVVHCESVRVPFSKADSDDYWLKVDPFIVSGGREPARVWIEYLRDMPKELRPYLRGIRRAILDERLVRVRASDFCNGHYWQADDGVRIAFTWRGWGDLMQAIVGKREGYLAYYC